MKVLSGKRRLSVWIVVLFISGCASLKSIRDGDIRDQVFGTRQDHVPANDSLLLAAKELTQLEDEVRRNGSITIKQPDVWGDANLMSSIQEHDWLMQATVDDFTETIQAYIARSDQAALHSETALGLAVNGQPTAPDALTTTQKNQAAAETTVINLGDKFPVFSALKTELASSPIKPSAGIGLEPTEVLRQQSNYIHVNQALRRRAMGDDNSRAAGYGLYKFRIPVSVIPGRQTHEGYAGMVTLQARALVDEAIKQFTKLITGNWGINIK